MAQIKNYERSIQYSLLVLLCLDATLAPIDKVQSIDNVINNAVVIIIIILLTNNNK